MKVLDRLLEAGRKLDRTAAEKTGASKIAAKAKSRMPGVMSGIAGGAHLPMVVIAAIVAILATTALGPRSGGKLQTGPGGEASGPTSTGDIGTVDTTGPTNPVTSGPVISATGRPSSGNPQVDADYAHKIGALLFPQSTSVPNGNRNTWVGVSDKEIKLAFTLDVQQCGADALQALQQAGGTLPASNRFYRSYANNHDDFVASQKESIDHIIRYFNDHAFDVAAYLPNIRPLMGNDPKYPFFGRRLTYEIIDAGNGQSSCAAETTAGAVQAISDKVYSVYTDNLDGSAFNMANALNAKAPPDKRPMHFGTLQLPDRYYDQWAPFAWSQFASGTQMMRQFGSYVCSRLVGQQVSRQVSNIVGQPTRKFGLIHPNLPESNALAGELHGYIKQYCGKDVIADDFDYEADISRWGDQSNTIISRMHADGVTSFLMNTDLLFPVFLMQSASQSRFLPEWVWPGLNYTDASAVQRSLYQALYKEQVDKASFGLSAFGIYGGFGYGAGDTFYLYHGYHPTAPDGKPCDPSSEAGMSHGDSDTSGNGPNSPNARVCKAPATIVTMYYTFLASLSCILFAGPNLTPSNCSKGLQSIPTIRYGGSGPTLDPRPALIGSGPGKYSFIVDSIEWKWRAGFTSPYPEHKVGWAEFPDCMRHYVTWPNGLAQDWEKSGPNYNSWCGAAKYAPDDSAEKDNYPRITDGRTAAEAKY